MTQEKTVGSSKRVLALVAIFFLYAMIAFVTNLAAPIGTIWGYQFAGNAFLGMLGNMANFAAYFIMGIPAGIMLTRIGYKKTALVAVILGIVGLLVQWLSAILGQGVPVFEGAGYVVELNFLIYLLGAFICGFCVCILNTVCNPLITAIGGGGNKGNQLLQWAGSCNSLAGTLAPFLVGALIGQLTPRTAFGDVLPLIWIGVGIFAVVFFFLYTTDIPEPGLERRRNAPDRPKLKDPYSPWSFRHTVLGVIAIFFYVGTEVAIPGTLMFYLSDQGANGAGVIGDAAAIAGTVVAFYWLFMLLGRFIGGLIGGKVSPRTLVTIVATAGIALVIGAIFIPKTATMPVPEFVYVGPNGELASIPGGAYLLVLCGLCTSVMWGCIFNLATDGLGKYTEAASGIFMMMVVGGGVMPLLQNLIADSAGYMTSYWLVVAMFGYILFYAFSGSRNVNTDIPVNEEELDPRNL